MGGGVASCVQIAVTVIILFAVVGAVDGMVTCAAVGLVGFVNEAVVGETVQLTNVCPAGGVPAFNVTVAPGK